MTRWLLLGLGALLAVLGLIWALQGIGILGGSMMTGSRLWLVNGLIAIAAGLTLLVFTLRRQKPRKP